MGWTKRQLTDEALAELGVASSEFDIQPEETQRALRRLDAMMGVWEAKGVRVGYRFPAPGDESDPDDDSGLPDAAVQPVFLNLSIKLAPIYGKQAGPDTKASAREGYDTLLIAAAQPQSQQFPQTLPRGAGNRPWRTMNRPFFPVPTDDALIVTNGGDLDILSE